MASVRDRLAAARTAAREDDRNGVQRNSGVSIGQNEAAGASPRPTAANTTEERKNDPVDVRDRLANARILARQADSVAVGVGKQDNVVAASSQNSVGGASSNEARLSELRAEKGRLEAGLDLDGAARVQEEITKLEKDMGISFWQRLWNTEKGPGFDALLSDSAKVGKAVSGGVKSYLGAETDTFRSLYESGQEARTSRNKEAQEEYKYSLDRAKRDLESMLEDNRLNPGTWTERDLKSQQNIVDDWQRKYDAMSKVTGERMQEKATQAAAQLADQASYSAERDIAASKDGKGALWGLGMDAVAAGTQMLLDGATGQALGAGESKAFKRGIGLAAMGFRSFGSGTQQARLNGAKLANQLGFGAATAAVELISEKIFDGLAGLYGAGAADEVVEKVIRKMAKTENGQLALRVLSSGAGEALEEVISGAISPALESIYDGKNPLSHYSMETVTDILHDAAVGGILGGIGGSVNVLKGQNNQTGTTGTAQEATQQDAGARIAQQETVDTAQQKAAAEAATGGNGQGTQTTTGDTLLDAIIKTMQPVTNRQAEALINDPASAAQLGIDTNGMTKSQQRSAVKERVAQMQLEVPGEKIYDRGTDPLLQAIVGGISTQQDVENQNGFDTKPDVEYNKTGRSREASDAMARLNSGDAVELDVINRIPEIMMAEQRNREEPTINRQNRKAIQDNGYEQAMKQGSFDGSGYNGPVRQERRMDIVIGLPGSGKSSVYTERISREHGSRVIDTDDYRAYIPEYDGINAGVVHEEASEIKDRVMEASLDRGDNIILSTIGANAQSLETKIRKYSELGYSVYLHLNELPNNKSMARAIGRFIGEDGKLGRFVSPDLIYKYGDKPTQTYLILTGQGGHIYGENLDGAVSGSRGTGGEENAGDARTFGGEKAGAAEGLAGWDWYNNDVAYGQPPRLIQSSEQSASGTVGAAASGFTNSDYGNLQLESSQFHSEGANAARPVDVPMYDGDGNPVSRFASNMMGAKAIPDDVIPMIQQMVADGELSYQARGNKNVRKQARASIREKGFDGAMEQLRAAVRDGKSDVNTVALGTELLVNAANAGDANAVAEIASLMQASSTRVGQAMQYFTVLRKLSPSAQLYAIQKTVEQLNEKVSKRGKKTGEKAGEVENRIHEGYDIALSLISDIIDVFSEGGKKNYTLGDVINKYKNAKGISKYLSSIDSFIAKEKDSRWVDRLGKEIAQAAVKRASVVEQSGKTAYQTIYDDLNAFMRQYVDKRKNSSKPRTAAERIADYFANREEYARAWNTAVSRAKEMSKNDAAMMDRLEDFFQSGSPARYSGGATDKIMMRAVADAAVSSDKSIREQIVRAKFDKDALSDEISKTLIEQTGANGSDAAVVKDAVRRYVAETAATSSAQADQYLKTDIRSALKDAKQTISEVIKKSRGEKGDIEKRLSAEIANRYGISEEASASISEEIARQFRQMVEAASKARLEAMFKERGNKTGKSEKQIFEELANLGAFSDESYVQDAAEKVFSHSVTIPQELVEKFLSQTDQEGRDTVMEEIYQNVADQVPPTWKDRWDAWRYMSMLANPRTHIRNIAGNLGFQPIRVIKNELAAGMERLFNVEEKTKSFVSSPAMYRAAWADYDNVGGLISGNRYSDAKSEIERRRRSFDTKALEAVSKGNSKALDLEDAAFKRITYADALAGYLTANGVKAEQLDGGTVPAELLSRARDYAASEALKATYQDDNAVSRKVQELGKTLGVVGEAILPFKKTPANILARGFEYSPAGLAKALTYDLAKVQRGEMSAAQAIDSVASGLTGTGLFALGAYLFAQGLVTGAKGDDKEDKWDELLGHQGYALELPDGTSVTLDWLAPEALPFFMGAEFMSSVGESGWTGDEIVSALLDATKSVADPIIEMSMLQGINDLIENVKYADGSPLSAMIPSVITSYLSQAVPTVLGQIERTSEPVRMTTYTDKNGKLPNDLQYAIGRVSARTPGLDYQQIPYIDAWGRTEESGDVLVRALNNTLNPAYMSQVDVDNVESELQRLYDSTGESGVFPNRAEKSFTVDGEEKYLSAEEYVKYAKELGQSSYQMVRDGMATGAYKAMRDAEKAEYISDLYSYAKASAKANAGGNALEGWQKNAKTAQRDIGVSTAEYIALYQKYGSGILSGTGYEKTKEAVRAGLTVDQYASIRDGLDRDGNGSVSQEEAKEKLDSMDFSREQKDQLWTIINNTWKKNPYAS